MNKTQLDQINSELDSTSWDSHDTTKSLSFCAQIIVRKHFDLRPSEVSRGIQNILEDYVQTVLWASAGKVSL